MISKCCDRCGDFYHIKPHETGGVAMFEDIDKNGSTRFKESTVRDLCPDCIKEMKGFFCTKPGTFNDKKEETTS